MDGKAEARFDAPSQDTGLTVLVVMERVVARHQTSPFKRRMRPAPLNRFQWQLNDLHSPCGAWRFFVLASAASPGLQFTKSRASAKQKDQMKYQLTMAVKSAVQGVAAMGLIIGTLALQPLRATTINEDFSSAPSAWKSSGEGTLFNWNSADQNLSVTWDSSKPNTYFYLPLGMNLSRRDDFSLRFTMKLRDIQVGVDPAKPFSFQIAAGLINLVDAANPAMLRGAGVDPDHGARNFVEFDYFPDSGFGATIAPTVISSNNQFAATFDFPLEISQGDLFEIEMNYSAQDQTLHSTMLKNGQPFGNPPDNTLKDVVLGKDFSDFAVNAFAVCSFNDAGQTPPEYAGSVLAHGAIDDVRIALPDPPNCSLGIQRAGSHVTLSFTTDSSWSYLLQRSSDFLNWTDAVQESDGTGSMMTVIEPLVGNAQFFRVRVSHR